MEVINYDKDNFLFKDMLAYYLGSFKNKFYVYFYDLEPLLFDEVIFKIDKLTDEMEVTKKKIKKTEVLLILGKFKNDKKRALATILDELHVGEFEIFEYEPDFNVEITNFGCTKKPETKHLYINKDEAVLQLYNY